MLQNPAKSYFLQRACQHHDLKMRKSFRWDGDDDDDDDDDDYAAAADEDEDDDDNDDDDVYDGRNCSPCALVCALIFTQS